MTALWLNVMTDLNAGRTEVSDLLPHLVTGGRKKDPSATARVAPATERDIPQILDLIRGLADYEHLGHLMTADEANVREALFGPQPIAEVLVAHCEGGCAGFALFFPTFCSVLGRRGMFLDNLYVKPEIRGCGVGHALMCRLVDIARERNYARLEWMVLNWNAPAIEFYKREGASFLQEWTKCRMTEEDMRLFANPNREVKGEV